MLRQQNHESGLQITKTGETLDWLVVSKYHCKSPGLKILVAQLIVASLRQHFALGSRVHP